MRPRLVIPQGDAGGIGPEVALKVLASPELRRRARPLLLGHLEPLRELAARLGLDLELAPVADAGSGFALADAATSPLPVLELESPEPPASVPAGHPHAAFGAAAVEGVLRAGSMCLSGEADAMVTPPIHKESMHLAGYSFEGQTQMLGELARSRRYGMLACAGKLRVLLATRHLALAEAVARLDVDGVAKQLRIAHEAARDLLAVDEPRIVLAALNPHAGEGGAFGDEEERILRPAIEKVRNDFGWNTSGPAVPDVVFAEGAAGRWDVVVALYHDQGFIPLKMLPRAQAWTLLVGTPILRTSPMHGAAYDLAGRNEADPAPLAFAVDRALELAARRAAVTR